MPATPGNPKCETKAEVQNGAWLEANKLFQNKVIMWHGTWSSTKANISRNTNFSIFTFVSREAYIAYWSISSFCAYKIKKNAE